jgi:hypothetical protein
MCSVASRYLCVQTPEHGNSVLFVTNSIAAFRRTRAWALMLDQVWVVGVEISVYIPLLAHSFLPGLQSSGRQQILSLY